MARPTMAPAGGALQGGQVRLGGVEGFGQQCEHHQGGDEADNDDGVVAAGQVEGEAVGPGQPPACQGPEQRCQDGQRHHVQVAGVHRDAGLGQQHLGEGAPSRVSEDEYHVAQQEGEEPDEDEEMAQAGQVLEGQPLQHLALPQDDDREPGQAAEGPVETVLRPTQEHRADDPAVEDVARQGQRCGKGQEHTDPQVDGSENVLGWDHVLLLPPPLWEAHSHPAAPKELRHVLSWTCNRCGAVLRLLFVQQAGFVLTLLSFRPAQRLIG